MNYSLYFKSLVKEATDGKQYKRLATAGKVFGFIGVFPFIVASVLLSIAFNVYIFVFNLLSCSVDYLESWLKSKKDDSRWFGEGVIFLVALPFVFLNHILLSFLTISFFVIWFFMQCTFYIATLGGTRWQPYISKVDLNDGKHFVATTNITAGNVTSIVIGAIYSLYLFLSLIGLFVDDYDYSQFVSIIKLILQLGTVITVPIVFKKGEASLNDDELDEADEDDDFMLPTL